MNDDFIKPLLKNYLFDSNFANVYITKKYSHFWPDMLKKDGLLIRYIPHAKNDPELCKIALTQNPHAIRYITNEMKENIEVCKCAFINAHKYNKTIEYTNRNWFDFISEKIKNNKEFCRYIAINYEKFIVYFNNDIKNDLEFYQDVFMHNKLSVGYMPEKMKSKFININNAIELIKEFFNHLDITKCIWDCIPAELQFNITIHRAIAFYANDTSYTQHIFRFAETALNDKEVCRIIILRDPMTKFAVIDAKNNYIYDYICAMQKLSALYVANEDFFEYGQNCIFFEMIYNFLKSDALGDLGEVPSPKSP
jgi:hypothetical protein